MLDELIVTVSIGGAGRRSQRAGVQRAGPGQLKGRSGVLHFFSACAFREREKETVIDMDEDRIPVEISLVALYAKALDTYIERPILVTSATLLDQEKTLAEMYNIQILRLDVSAEDLKQQLKGILLSNSADSSSNTVYH